MDKKELYKYREKLMEFVFLQNYNNEYNIINNNFSGNSSILRYMNLSCAKDFFIFIICPLRLFQTQIGLPKKGACPLLILYVNKCGASTFLLPSILKSNYHQLHN
ncbi:hypothetical protein DFO70_103489 [Cytobacillus firmus]|uniref:Uncharacterized protein n=2 Tax=Cytobacillus TaxID=2675230 RepID=A0A366K140_CYTFI|nr:hypothetical protein DFO70_103489 [Cytobacillus firmus]TDX44286.1 hypothetical protein DFO72_104502 [Cytobacillus oceanisediminis]